MRCHLHSKGNKCPQKLLPEPSPTLPRLRRFSMPCGKRGGRNKPDSAVSAEPSGPQPAHGQIPGVDAAVWRQCRPDQAGGPQIPGVDAAVWRWWRRMDNIGKVLALPIPGIGAALGRLCRPPVWPNRAGRSCCRRQPARFWCR